MTEPSDEAPPVEEANGPPGQARERHLGFVAHEIRNPLSTALWTAELLARIPPAERGGARGEKLAAMCLRSVSKVRILLEDHLLSERLDTGAYPLRTERVPVSEVLGAALERLPSGHPGVEQEIPVGLAVEADRLLLQRALEGLLALAVVDGRPARMEARAAGGRVELSFPGAPAGPLQDPQKGSPSDQRGRALTLPAIRRVAAALGGALTAGPEGFLLSIPAA